MTDLSKNIQALREKKAVVEMGGGEAATEKVATINQILNTIFFIISFLGKTKVTKIH